MNEKKGRVFKVRQQTGASFALALLLFLVCALLSSVMISAGSATVVRQGQLATMEQRYYSVTSAAELIKSQFEDKKVEVECTSESSSSPGGDPIISIKIGDVTLSPGNTALTESVKRKLNLAQLSALYLLAGSQASSIDLSAAWQNSTFPKNPEKAAEFSVPYELTGNVTPTGLDADSLAVNVEELIGQDGSLRFIVSSAPESGAGGAGADAGKYTLTLVCDADINVRETVEESTSTTWHTAEIKWVPSALLVGR